VENLVELLLRQRFGALLGRDGGFNKNLVGAGGTNSVNVAEGIRDFLFRGDFNTEETWHGWIVVGLLKLMRRAGVAGKLVFAN
jgi:hypothetical protein